MTINLSSHKIAKSANANVLAKVATSTEAPNGTYVIDQHNNLTDAVQTALNNLSSGVSTPTENHVDYITVFVNSVTGDDNYAGLSNSTAFKTIAKALQYIKSKKVVDGVNLSLSGEFNEPIDLRGMIATGHTANNSNGAYGNEFYLYNGNAPATINLSAENRLILPDNASNWSFNLGSQNTTWNLAETLSFNDAYVIFTGNVSSTKIFAMSVLNGFLTLNRVVATAVGNGKKFLQAINSKIEINNCSFTNFNTALRLEFSELYESTATSGTGNTTAVSGSKHCKLFKKDNNCNFASGVYTITKMIDTSLPVLPQKPTTQHSVTSFTVNSDTGNDANIGSDVAPFKTLKKAIQAVKEKLIVTSMYINCTGNFDEEIDLRGVYGVGKNQHLIFTAIDNNDSTYQPCTFNMSKWLFPPRQESSLLVDIQHLSIDCPEPIYIDDADVTIDSCVITNSGSNTDSNFLTRDTRLRLASNTFTGSNAIWTISDSQRNSEIGFFGNTISNYDTVVALEGGYARVHSDNTIGSEVNTIADVSKGGIVFFSGFTPDPAKVNVYRGGQQVTS